MARRKGRDDIHSAVEIGQLPTGFGSRCEFKALIGAFKSGTALNYV
jgi:hypothetical protein